MENQRVQCSKGDNCSFPHDINKRAKLTQRLGGPARIASKELAPFHSVKSGTSRMLVLQVREWLQIWGKVLLCASPV